MWKGYYGIGDDGTFQHLTINHSESFSDSNTVVHTNTIEGTWNSLKMLIKPRNRVKESIEKDHLWEFIWRKLNVNDPWQGYL